MTGSLAWGPVGAAAVAGAVLLWQRPRFAVGRRPCAWPWAPPLAAGAALAWAGVSWAPALLWGLAALAGGGALWRAGRRRTLTRQRQARVLEACGVLAAELAAGQPSAAALARAAEEWGHLAPAAEAAALGADVSSSLRSLAETPGTADLALVAGAWQVAHTTGSGLAGALEMVVDDLRAARETDRVVASELASARATARLLAALPVAALVMGRGAGGDPVGFLLREPAGWLCAAAGLLLLLSGLAWIEGIAARVEAGR